MKPAQFFKSKPKSRARSEAISAFLFLLPQTIGLLVLIAGPLFVSIYLTFTKWDLVSPSPTWIGLENWKYLASDQHAWQALANTGRFILFGTLSFLLIGLVAALLTWKPRRGVGLYRALLFLPYVLSQIAVGLVWRWIFNTESGALTELARAATGSSPQWLLEPAWAMPSIAAMTTWQALGFAVTLYIAGLNGVPQSLLDAARVDGTSVVQRFWHVVLPSMAPTVMFLTVTSVIGALQLYDPVVAMTSPLGNPADAGGPSGSTRSVVLYLYQQMFTATGPLAGLGYAATVGWLLAFIALFVTAAQFLIFQRSRAGSL